MSPRPFWALPWTCLPLPRTCSCLFPVTLPSPSSTLPWALLSVPLTCSSVTGFSLQPCSPASSEPPYDRGEPRRPCLGRSGDPCQYLVPAKSRHDGPSWGPWLDRRLARTRITLAAYLPASTSAPPEAGRRSGPPRTR